MLVGTDGSRTSPAPVRPLSPKRCPSSRLRPQVPGCSLADHGETAGDPDWGAVAGASGYHVFKISRELPLLPMPETMVRRRPCSSTTSCLARAHGMRLCHVRAQPQGRYGPLLRIGRDTILTGEKDNHEELARRCGVGGSAGSRWRTSPQGDHAYVFGGVTIYRGSGPAVAEYTSPFTSCSGTSCAVTVAAGKRDYGRFVKWCGAARRDVTVTSARSGATWSAGDRRPGI